MEFKTRLPDLSGELYQDGQKLTDVNYSETDAVLTGEDVTSSVYVGGTQAIDFKEEVTVIPFDTPAGTLNPGPQWALRFDENFDGPAIDLNKWNVQDSSKALQYASEKEAYAHGVSSIAPGNTYSVNTADCVEIKDGNAVFKLEKLSAPRVVDGIERTHKGAY